MWEMAAMVCDGWRLQNGLIFGKFAFDPTSPHPLFWKLMLQILFQFHAQNAQFKGPKSAL